MDETTGTSDDRADEEQTARQASTWWCSTLRFATASSRRASRSTRPRSSRSPSSWPGSASTTSRPGSRWPAQGDFEAVQAIARSVGNAPGAPAICGLSRTQLSDVDRCWEALRDAARARIHVFISTSPQHMEHMLKMTQAQVLAETKGGRGPRPRAHGRRGVQPPGRHAHAAGLHARGAGRRGRGGGDHAEHPRHGRLRHPLGLRRAHPAHPQAGARRLRPLHPLPQRPGPGHRQHAGGRPGRRPPGRGVRERAGRARRQCRARGGGDGPARSGPTSSPG